MRKAYFILFVFTFSFIQNSDAQLLKRIGRKVKETAEGTIEKKTEEKTQEETEKAFDNVFTSDTTQQKKNGGSSYGLSDKEPPSSYQFKHRVDMRMTSGKDGKDSVNLNYFLPETGNFMCTMVEGQEAMGSLSVIDLDKSAMFMFMDQGGSKTRMAIDLDMKSANDEAAEETNYVVTKTGKTKMILGYNCEEYLIVGEDMKINGWVTKEVDIRFPEAFYDVEQKDQADQAWVNEMDGFAMEMTMVDTSKKKPQSTKIVCTGIETSKLNINTGDYSKFSY